MIDFWGSLLLLIILFPVFIIISFLIKLTASGSIFHISPRIGKNESIFLMPKFRTMTADTPLLPPYVLNNPEKYYTKFGVRLRKYYLDELPQLWTILVGKMSFIGPRPGLAKYERELDNKRKELNIYHLKPGLTGWAQVNGDGNVPIKTKVMWDKYYLDNQSFWLDIRIAILTLKKYYYDNPHPTSKIDT